MSNTWFRLRRGFFLSFFPSDTPHYENVPFEVPSSWVWCRLDDIVSFQGGYAYKSNTYVNQSDWQVIRIGNVKNDNLILDIQPVFVEDVIGKTTEKYLLKKDDILFTMTGTKGKRDYFYTAKVPSIKKNLLLNQRVGCLRCFSSEINIDFLCLVLKGEYVLDAIFSTETGNVSQGNIGSESTLNLNIAIPPLTEQHRIVVEIEKWFALIDQIEQGKSDLQSTIKQTKSKILDLAIHGKLVPQDPNDEPASELLKRINPNFTPCDNGHYTFDVPSGWITTNLGSIFNVVSAKRILKSDWKHSGVPFYRAREIAKLSIYGLVDNELYISEEHYNSLKEKFPVPKASDIMISAIGTIGKCYIVKESDKFYYKDASVLCLCNDYQINTKYIYHIMRSEYMLKQMYDNSKGTTVDTITIEKAKQYILPLPPLAEQQRIVAKIEETFSIFDGIQNSLEA